MPKHSSCQQAVHEHVARGLEVDEAWSGGHSGDGLAQLEALGSFKTETRTCANIAHNDIAASTNLSRWQLFVLPLSLVQRALAVNWIVSAVPCFERRQAKL
jgi:hypothetical protein